MPNTILTAQAIAREALPVLKSNTVFARLVRTDFKDEVKGRFDTVNVPKPPVFTAGDFNGTANVQDVAEAKVPVTLDKIASVDMALESREMTLVDFMKDIGQPAMAAIAEKIDADLAGLAELVPYTSGTAGTTPSTLADLAAPMKALNIAKAPLVDRFGVLDPEAHAKLVQLDGLARVDASGMTGTLREAAIGRVYGIDFFMNQNVKAHTKGDLAAAATLSGAKGALTGTIAAGGNVKTLKKGDVFTLADIAGQYVATADAVTLADGTGSVSFYPALPAIASGKTITVIASHRANVVFNRNAFALVTRPLAPAQGAESSTMAYDGFPLRVTFSWDHDAKKQRVAFDLLYGLTVLYPELAVRMLG